MDDNYDYVKRTLAAFISHNKNGELLRDICYNCDITEDESIEDYYAKRANSSFPWWAAGMTKFVFSIPDVDNYVFKIPFLTRFWYKGTDKEERLPQEDYCKYEAENYKLAKEKGVSDFFAETVYLCTFEDVPIYISEDASISALDYCSNSVWHKTSNRSKKWSSAHFERQQGFGFDDEYAPIAWLADRVDLLKIIDLLDFFREYKIVDIHSGNFVYTKDGILIVDYSGFGRYRYEDSC